MKNCKNWNTEKLFSRKICFVEEQENFFWHLIGQTTNIHWFVEETKTFYFETITMRANKVQCYDYKLQ